MKYNLALVTIGMLLIAAAIVVPIFAGIAAPVYRWLYAAGALILLIGRVTSRYKGDNLRLRRLYRIETWSALFFCVAAIFLFYPPGNNLRDVLAFTLAGGIIQIYTSIMIPKQQKSQP